jgi:hypothetical protein
MSSTVVAQRITLDTSEQLILVGEAAATTRVAAADAPRYVLTYQNGNAHGGCFYDAAATNRGLLHAQVEPEMD